MAKSEKKSKKSDKKEPGMTFGRDVRMAICLLVPLIAVVLFGARMYFRLPVTNYYGASEKGFVIPGLNKNFVPQGLSYDKGANVFFVTGYQKDGTASPIYLVDGAKSETRGKVLLQAPDGSDFEAHAGGLCVLGDYVYVAGGEDACVYAYDREKILQAYDGEKIPCVAKVDTYFGEREAKRDGLTVAFVTSDNSGMLTVGEFYRDPNYPTPDTHKFTSPAGDYLQALAVTYKPLADADGIRLLPWVAYALPDLVQGMAFHDGRVWLSTSYGAAFSNVYVYNLSDLKQFGTLADIDGDIPLYALDSAALNAQYKLPPMSEEIEFVNGKMYTMCESASNKYIFGKLTGGEWCYATDIGKMKNELEQETN